MTQSSPKKITKLYRLAIRLFLLTTVLIALYVVIARHSVIWIADYKLQLQEELSKTLNTPVTISNISGGWDIFSPTITIKDVHIGNQEQHLTVDQLTIELDIPSSILNRQLRIDKVYGENLNLQIRENEPGIWSIGGIPRHKDPIKPETLFTILQRFEKLSISDSTISIYPYQQTSRVFTHINATLTHFSDKDMRLDGILYINNEKPLILSVEANIAPKEWNQFRAKFYANIPYLNWQSWLPKDITSPWKIDNLELGGDVWGSIRNGELQSLTINTKGSQVTASYKNNKPVIFKNINMQLWLNCYKQSYLDLQITDLALDANDIPIQNSNLQLLKQHMPDIEQWQIQSSTFNIENTIPTILALAPIPQKFQNAIHDIAPKGVINNLQITWLPHKPLIESLKFSADVENISFNPIENTVGAGNITGKIQGGIDKGALTLDAKDFSLFIAKLYNKPWSYQHATTVLNWSFDNEIVSIFSHKMDLKADEGDLTGDMMIRLHVHDPIKDYMDLRVNINNGNASYTPKYIPSKANVSPDLIHWLNTAIVGGDIETGYFQYQGSLNSKTLPIEHALLLYMKVNNAEVNYQKPWLPIRNIDGEIFVEPAGIRILASRGMISKTPLHKINVRIPHTDEKATPYLYATADLKSTISDTLHVLKNAPPQIAETFVNWQGNGNLQGKLDLTIPLKKNQQPHIITDFTTYNASLNLQHPIPPLTNISGNFHFDSLQGLSSEAITARVFENTLQGTIEADGKNTPSSHFKLKGIINTAKLIHWYFPALEEWPIRGETPYNLDIWIGNSNQLKLSSTLKGFQINLPAPFHKAAETTNDIAFQMSFGKTQPTKLMIDYGTLINAAITMNNHGQNWQGELLFNQGKASFSEKKGLQIRGNFGQIDLEAWYKLYSKYIINFAPTQNQFDTREINSISILIGKVVGFNIPPQQAAIYIQPAGNTGWQLNINSPSLFGRLIAPQTKDLPYYIHLTYLKLPETLISLLKDEKNHHQLIQSKIPSLNLSIQQLFLGNELIGRIKFNNTPYSEGLKITNMALNLKGVNIQGDLDWQIGKQSTFIGRIFGKNLEQVFTNWHIEPGLSAESFTVSINGTWKGSPADFSSEHFTGTLSPELKSGRILRFDESSANILRIFGILNLEAITKQLRLDFTDFYKPGLAFTKIKGELQGNDGLLKITKPILLEGPSMMISMTGQVNMQTKQIDAIVKVGIPLVSSLTIATLAVTPPVGGAMLIADYFLGNKLMKIATVDYSVKGDWNNPEIKRDLW